MALGLPKIFRSNEGSKTKEKVDPKMVIGDALQIMKRIESEKDDIGKRRWENKLHECGLSGNFESILADLDLAGKNPAFYAISNPSKAKNIIDNFNNIKNFLDSEK
jgi:hypothetical protein